MNYQKNHKKRIAITGGAGFIGANLIQYLVPQYPEYLFVNIDCLTYAGNLTNLRSVEKSRNYIFEKIDITDLEQLKICFEKYDINALINMAAESHVDRSILGPTDFIKTNIIGTFNLLELARQRRDDFRFHHISTDEVFGALDKTGYFNEKSPYNPSSPYAASKAGSDHLVSAYYKTYHLDCVISNSSNNFGPYQFPEKLIPLIIMKAVNLERIPIYGDGSNIRDWLYVGDHCRAIDLIFHKGESGGSYNVGGQNEITNISLAKKICRIIDNKLGYKDREKLIEFVSDRPGHDWRYAIDSSKIENELGWKASATFDVALKETVEWYLENNAWIENCLTGDYLKYYDDNYGSRI
ncbi:MAG: dTDP-glucose 4,6-dehydratase [Candidatus Zixiibacteriota bacterium]